MPRFLAPTVLACLVATGAPAQTSERPEPTIEEMRTGIENQHPSVPYMLAMRLFESGERDEAVFWFYVGQLRYRVHLTCDPDLPPDGDPALFGALSEVFGAPLNGYAFGDPDRLAETIGEVIEWDASTPNGFTDLQACAEAHETVVSGLEDLRTDIIERAEEIRQERLNNGLDNR